VDTGVDVAVGVDAVVLAAVSPVIHAGRPAPDLVGSSAPHDFERVYATAFDDLLRYAFLLTGSRHVAEELVQDCFLRAHARWSTIDTPKAYLRTSVTHACRSQQRRWMLERAKAPAPALVETNDPEIVELRASLLRLPYRQRAAVVLRFYVDLPDHEIAEILGCRHATVRSLIHRGLAVLREEVGPDVRGE